MAVSRNTTTLSRRTIVSGLAVASAAAAVPMVVASASTTHPDAVLLDLGRQLRSRTQVIQDFMAADRRLYEMIKAATPALPEVLRYTDQDRAFGFPEPSDDRWPGFHAPSPIHFLESYPAKRKRLLPFTGIEAACPLSDTVQVLLIEDGKLLEIVPWPEAIQRRDEIVAAANEYQAAVEAVEVSVGYDRNDQTMDNLIEEQWEIVHRITEEPAHTLDGLAVKALAVQLVDHPDSEVKLGEYPFDELVASAINGLIRLSMAV